jgi:hypothetical protein
MLIIFHDSLSSGKRVVNAGGRTDRQTGMTQLTVDACNFVERAGKLLFVLVIATTVK